MSEYLNIKYDTAISWQSTVQTGNFTAVSGQGYFVNTTSGDVTVTLPASPVVGDFVGIIDYARTFGTNKCVIGANGSNLEGGTADLKLATNGATATLVYADATKGWSFVQQSNVPELPSALFVIASGGTETTDGDYKVHTFNSSGTFTVNQVGNACGSTTVDYLVVAGGAGGGGATNLYGGGGGGAGGFRQSYPNPATGGFPVSVTSYPITVGGGGAEGARDSAPGGQGSNSIFSSITSAGGGYGSKGAPSPGVPGAWAGNPGGSGGGHGSGSAGNSPGGSGNSPPVTPPQGQPGGSGGNSGGSYWNGAGGGGHTNAGGNNPPSNTTGTPGGSGTASTISGSSVTRAGGGGAGGGTGGPGGGGKGAGIPNANAPAVAGTANTGGGGGAGVVYGSACAQIGRAGGSGVVIIRYKFQ